MKKQSDAFSKKLEEVFYKKNFFFFILEWGDEKEKVKI